MTKSDGDHSVIVLSEIATRIYAHTMDRDSGRFIAVNLTDAEWQALRSVTPDPVAWVKGQIHRLLDESGVTPIEDLGHDPTPLLELAD